MTASTGTQPTAWAHLPNAQHIDRVVADVKARPQAWDAAWLAARASARIAALDAIRVNAWASARIAALDAIRVNAWAADGAIVALVAWDDCAYILDMPPDACRVLATLGNHAAVLLYPAVIALNGGGDAQAT